MLQRITSRFDPRKSHHPPPGIPDLREMPATGFELSPLRRPPHPLPDLFSRLAGL